MAGGNLDNIMGRLICCRALLDAIRWAMTDESSTIEDALAGAGDLLTSICKDFEADIDAAEDFIPAAEVVK